MASSEAADALDILAGASSRVRRLLPRATAEQLDALADCSPWGEQTEDTLIQMETWAIVAATGLREEVREYLREVGT